jgi:hypothetical protein
VSGRATTLEEARVNVRQKISASWVALLLLFAYGDVFGFLKPGRIEEVTRGRISGMEITQTFLLAVSVYIAIASLMVVLTLVLRPGIARWSNIVLAVLYILSIAASVFGEWAYFWFLSVVEVAVLAAIVWLAWNWPTTSDH